MTITRRFQAGAEADGANSYTEFDNYNTVTCETAHKKSGARSYYFNDQYDYLDVGIPSSLQFRAGCHVRMTATGDYGANQWIMLFKSGNTAVVGVRVQANQSKWELYVNGAAQTTKYTFSLDTWYRVGLDFKIAASGGWARVYVNGALVISEDSDNTGTSECDLFQVGPHTVSSGDDLQCYVDDIYVDDTTGESAADVPPDLRFEFLTPDGNGNYSQLDGSDGNQVNNYEQADDRPHDSDTTYNEAQAADEKDSYTLTTFAVPGGWKIRALIPRAVARKTDAATASQLALMLREGGTDDEGTAQNLGMEYAAIWERFTADPGGSNWRQNAVDGLEAGVWAEGSF